MNAPFNLRQLAQYPRQTAVPAGSVALIQLGDIGAPYGSILASDFVATSLASGGTLNLNGTVGGAIQWSASGSGGPVTLSAVNGDLLVEAGLRASSVSATFIDAVALTQGGVPVVTQADLAAASLVTSFNLRTGDIMLMPEDILRAGGAPIRDAHFAGWITAPSVWDARANDDTVATTCWVHRAIHDTGVSSFNGRTGDIVLTTADINAATAAGPGYPTAPSPVLGDASNRVATTLFVDESLQDLHLTISNEQLALLTSTYAPINSPQLTGIPTAPTANPGTSTGQLATTSFVMHAVTAGTAGVSSFNTRTGAVVLNTGDITSAGGATLASPAFSGNPTAPTAAPGTSNAQLATTAFVQAAVGVAGGVTSFNTRVGAVTLTSSDVSGTGVLANTPLTGVPTAPTAAPGTSTTQLATTAFVAASAAAGVTSFMSRTGAVTLTSADVSAAGGALNASPVFTGTPTAPTAAPGTNTTQLATTAYVQAALTAGGGVTTFNGRAGAVTLTLADVTGAGGAPLVSPTFTGTPASVTPSPGDNSTNIATTAFVQVALSGATPGWTFASSGGVSTQTALNPAVLNLNGGTTTFNPSDILQTTLSNGNLTATAGVGNGGVRAVNGVASGKYYLEYTFTAIATTNYGAGFAIKSVPLNSGLITTGVFAVNGSGQIGINTGVAGNLGALANGNVIGVAIDVTAQLIWFRIAPSGNWNGSGTANPATGAGGLAMAAAGSVLFPYVGCSAASGGQVVTANFGASAFVGAVPSGFGKVTAIDYQINNKNSGGIIQVLDNTSESATPANFLQFKNNITGQPSIISTLGTDTNRGIQLVPSGTGTVQAPTMTAGDNSTAIATTAFVHSAVSAPILRSYLAGLGLSTAGSSATFSVAAGVATDSQNFLMMTLASAMSKTTAAWAAGTGNGSLDTGTIANSTWYHVYLIYNSSTQATDIAISLSVSSPTYPSGYSYARRIGSMKTNASGQWWQFLQTGDLFEWNAAVAELSGTTVSTTASTLNLAGVPNGFKVNAILTGFGQSTATTAFLTISDNDMGTGVYAMGTPVANVNSFFNVNVETQAVNATIKLQSANASMTGFNLSTIGWRDRRGQDA